MGEPQLSEAAESDRRSSPRFPAALLGQASVRLLGGSEVILINFSERGILFQSETRLLVGARGTVRIVVATDTTIAAGTVVRSLVQGMASGKLAFHTALALDQPLAFALTVAARERARAAEARAHQPAAVDDPVLDGASPVADAPLDEAAMAEAALIETPLPEPLPELLAEAPMPEARVPTGKTIEKTSHRKRAAAPAPDDTQILFDETPVLFDDAPAAPVEPPVALVDVALSPDDAPPPAEPAPPAATASSGFGDSGFGDSGFDGGSFGWADTAAERAAVAAGLSVLFVSTTKERTARLQGVLAGHRHAIVLTAVTHSTAETIAALARQHDVLLFDFSIGPEALERTLSALRTSPLGASIAILVPQQTALPPAVSSLANACVVETPSGDMLIAALRDAAWTPWQPLDGQAEAGEPRADVFWKAFDALPVPVLVVDEAGTILHVNGACTKLADGVDLLDRPLASFFVAGDGPAIAKLIADGFAGGFEDTPVFTAPADGQAAQIVLQALSVLPGTGEPRQLAMRCELRAEAGPPEPAASAAAELAVDYAALAASLDELTQIADGSRIELTRLREELDELRGQANGARRERDQLRGELEIAQRDLDRARELERIGAAKILELERVLAEGARMEAAAARAQSQLAGSAAELSTVRAELDALRLRTTTQGADAERTAVRYAAIETSTRQAIEELRSARAEAQRLTRERDQAVAAIEAERTRADAAVAAAREETRKPRKIVAEDAIAPSTAKLQRQLDELRAEVKQEQDARRELEELLDQNAENLEQTIQDYEAKLDALGAGADDERTPKPKRPRQG